MGIGGHKGDVIRRKLQENTVHYGPQLVICSCKQGFCNACKKEILLKLQVLFYVILKNRHLGKLSTILPRISVTGG